MSAANAIQPVQPSSLHNFSIAELADEHRGQSFAKRRVDDRLKAIEAELDRRGVKEARGAMALTTKKPGSPRFVDIDRLRADHPEICAAYAKVEPFWSSRTLSAEERA